MPVIKGSFYHSVFKERSMFIMPVSRNDGSDFAKYLSQGSLIFFWKVRYWHPVSDFVCWVSAV